MSMTGPAMRAKRGVSRARRRRGRRSADAVDAACAGAALHRADGGRVPEKIDLRLRAKRPERLAL